VCVGGRIYINFNIIKLVGKDPNKIIKSFEDSIPDTVSEQG
jgi:hypothetical protein